LLFVAPAPRKKRDEAQCIARHSQRRKDEAQNHRREHHSRLRKLPAVFSIRAGQGDRIFLGDGT
jgi:hypothetical protein